jgi:quercetin dioxygenase-like cupin family protein
VTALNRPLAGTTMLFDIDEEIATLRAGRSATDPGRTARTLLKDGPLRLTLTVLDAGAAIAEHSAGGPITIHVLAGTIRLHIDGREHLLESGSLVGAAAGVRHAVTADSDAAFLLTVVLPERPG